MDIEVRLLLMSCLGYTIHLIMCTWTGCLFLDVRLVDNVYMDGGRRANFVLSWSYGSLGNVHMDIEVGLLCLVLDLRFVDNVHMDREVLRLSAESMAR